MILILWLHAAALLMVVSSSSYIISKPGCVDKCGDLSIPYPFGMGDKNCFLDEDFNITCNETFNPPKAFLADRYEVLDINLIDAQLRSKVPIATDCYDKKGNQQTTGSISPTVTLEEKFTFSSTSNKLVAIGCDTMAIITESGSFRGCISSCDNIKDVINGSCTGKGCCQASIPNQMMGYKIELTAKYNRSSIRDFNPCNYAFLVDENWFKFSSLDLYDNQNRSKVPAVFDWVVGFDKCGYAKKNLAVTNYTCGVNSDCYDPSNGYGYRCKCLDGYEGNPYLINGCQDINECDESRERLCAYKARCTNTVGNYTCACPSGYSGDGTKQGSGCWHNKPNLVTIVYLASE